jgi:hypothetical protein
MPARAEAFDNGFKARVVSGGKWWLIRTLEDQGTVLERAVLVPITGSSLINNDMIY